MAAARIIWGRGRTASTTVRRAYLEQVEAIQTVGGRIILMASRALVRAARGPEDYLRVYARGAGGLRPAGDPALAGRDVRSGAGGLLGGARLRGGAGDGAGGDRGEHVAKVDGIKISLLDKDKEIAMRRRLPAGVRMYTGDDFNYPELIEGDAQGYSPRAARASSIRWRRRRRGRSSLLGQGDAAGFRAMLDPTVPLARLIFRAPTQYYKTGVVFLAWLNGFQDHFVMLNGAQAMRPLPYFTEAFRLADQCGLLRDPEMAVARMRRMLAMYGV